MSELKNLIPILLIALTIAVMVSWILPWDQQESKQDDPAIQGRAQEGSIETLQAQIDDLIKQIDGLSPEELEAVTERMRSFRWPIVEERRRPQGGAEVTPLSEVLMEEARRNSPAAIKRAADEFLGAFNKMKADRAKPQEGKLLYYEGTH